MKEIKVLRNESADDSLMSKSKYINNNVSRMLTHLPKTQMQISIISSPTKTKNIYIYYAYLIIVEMSKAGYFPRHTRLSLLIKLFTESPNNQK